MSWGSKVPINDLEVKLISLDHEHESYQVKKKRETHYGYVRAVK